MIKKTGKDVGKMGTGKMRKNGGRASLSNLRPKLVYKKILKKQTAYQVPIYGK
jgi:hypothetical protein